MSQAGGTLSWQLRAGCGTLLGCWPSCAYDTICSCVITKIHHMVVLFVVAFFTDARFAVTLLAVALFAVVLFAVVLEKVRACQRVYVR